MEKALYYFFLSVFLVAMCGEADAQNENRPVSPADSGKTVKRSRKERERPERTLFVRKPTIPVDKKRVTTGEWADRTVAFEENGKGFSENNPIVIEKAEQLAYLAKQVNAGNNCAGKHFRITADIDLAGREWTPVGRKGENGDDDTGRFCGYLHGGGHKVMNLTITKGAAYCGLFGVCGAGAYIENLEITNCYVRGKLIVGGLVGELTDGAVSGCRVAGSVIGTGDCVGGLAGISNGTITYCRTEATVHGAGSDVGGLIGNNGDKMSGIAENCRASGPVYGIWNVGGLIGRNNGIVSNCDASGNVTGEEWVGGLAGWADGGMISECSAGGNVKGFFDVGGLIGFNGYIQSAAIVGNCSASGEVTGSGKGNYCIGGLAGYSGGTIFDSYATGTVKGEESVGGLVGEHGGKTSRCRAEGNVAGSFDVGGLIGFNGYPGSRTIVEHSYATGSVSGFDVFNYGIGGLVGYSGGAVVGCYASGNVTGDESTGGLIGEQEGMLIDSYATGAVEGKMCAGGLVGWNQAVLQSCYATGTVKSEGRAGGLAGWNRSVNATITTCYFDTESTRQNTGIGRDENDQIDRGVIAKTTEELTGRNLPEGFDARVWQAAAGSYPKLKVFGE